MATNSKRILKRIGYALLVIIVLFIIAGFIGMRKFNNSFFTEKPNYLEFNSEEKPIHFDWVNDSIGDYYETQIAMTIPLQIEGFAHKLSMQFDSGAPFSYLYEKDLKSLKSIGFKYEEVIKDGERYVQNLEMTLGGNHFKASMIKILKNYGNTFNENDTINSLNTGTIGSDFLDNRITVVDFKNQTLQLYKERPEWMASLSDFQPFDFKGRRIMFPTIIDGKKVELLYDSGCSAFGLITSKYRYDNYTNNNDNEINYTGNRWGDALPMHHKTSNMLIEIGNDSLSLKRVSYVDMYAKYQRFVMPFSRVGGFLGNKPFTESTLILDTKKEEFLIY